MGGGDEMKMEKGQKRVQILLRPPCSTDSGYGPD